MLQAFDKEIDYLADNIAVTLHTSSYTPDQDAHDYAEDLSNELGTANGYTAGGQNLNDYTSGTNVNAFKAADVVWTASGTLTARTAVVSDITPGSAATNPLLTFHNSDADISATDAAWTFDVPAAGFASITPA
jgi:hypothetical protein